jgi:hypothetical protein
MHSQIWNRIDVAPKLILTANDSLEPGLLKRQLLLTAIPPAGRFGAEYDGVMDVAPYELPDPL